jgi:flagellin
VYVDASGASIAYNKFGRELVTHPSGNTGNGSISLNVVNLQFVLSLNGSANANVNLGGVGHTNSGITTTGLGDDNFITRIRDVSVSEIINAIEKLADARAENGAEQNRIMNSINLLQTNVTNLEAAHGRIMDADIALESTRFARYNVLVQASAAMTAQANQMTNVALSLLG